MIRNIYSQKIILFLFFVLSCFSLQAREQFIKVQYDGNNILQQPFRSPADAPGEFGIRLNNVRGTLHIPLSPSCCYGITLLAGGGTTDIDWSENPHFKKDFFAFYDFGLGAFTLYPPGWRIIALFAASFDRDNWGGDYIWYKGIVWAKWSIDWGWYDDMDLHFGLIGTSGLEETFILPIFGVTASPYPCWKLGLLFPLDLSVSYQFYPCTEAFVAMRGWRRRHRFSENAFISKGIWLYRNLGTEIGIRFDNEKWLEADVHVGITMRGDFKIMDAEGEDLQHYKPKHGLYVGVSASLGY